jgi:hypothetical protein
MLRIVQILSIFLLFNSCNEFKQAVDEAKKENGPIPKDNYVVLLDMSDRLLSNQQTQAAKDVAVVKTVLSAFKTNIDKKDPTRLYYTVKDKLKVLLSPQKSTPAALYESVGDLRIDFESEDPYKRAPALDSLKIAFEQQLPALYKNAMFSNKAADYTGADIWKYFNEDLEDDLVKDGQNTLFILTDGYMDFETVQDRPKQKNRFTSCRQIIDDLRGYPDWSAKFDAEDYGLMTVGKKFNNLRVVVLEMNPSQNWNGEYGLLTKIWSKWFKEMGIEQFHFIKNENINEVKESIENFMQLKIAGKIEVEKQDLVFDTVIPKPVVKTKNIVPEQNVVIHNDVTTPVLSNPKPAPLDEKPMKEKPLAKPTNVIALEEKKKMPPNKPALPDAESIADANLSMPTVKKKPVVIAKKQAPKKEDDIFNDASPKKKND